MVKQPFHWKAAPCCTSRKSIDSIFHLFVVAIVIVVFSFFLYPFSSFESDPWIRRFPWILFQKFTRSFKNWLRITQKLIRSRKTPCFLRFFKTQAYIWLRIYVQSFINSKKLVFLVSHHSYLKYLKSIYWVICSFETFLGFHFCTERGFSYFTEIWFPRLSSLCFGEKLQYTWFEPENLGSGQVSIELFIRWVFRQQ